MAQKMPWRTNRRCSPNHFNPKQTDTFQRIWTQLSYFSLGSNASFEAYRMLPRVAGWAIPEQGKTNHPTIFLGNAFWNKHEWHHQPEETLGFANLFRGLQLTSWHKMQFWSSQQTLRDWVGLTNKRALNQHSPFAGWFFFRSRHPVSFRFYDLDTCASEPSKSEDIYIYARFFKVTLW